MKRTIYPVIFMLVLGSPVFADWEINEITIPEPYRPYLNTLATDDYGNLYFEGYYNEEVGDPNNPTYIKHYALYKYDPFPNQNLTTIIQGEPGVSYRFQAYYGMTKYTFGQNIPFTRYNGSDNFDLFWYDGSSITHVTNASNLWIIGVAGESIYYSDYDGSKLRLWHAVLWHSTSGGQSLSCETLNTFGLGLDGDLSGDCYVNLTDLAIFSNDWLECNNPDDANCVSLLK